MIYTGFIVKNFRGIRDLSLDLSRHPHVPVVTLVGLNESGKTTVLEALAFFYENVGMGSGDDEVRLYSGVVDDMHTLIPKRSRANFNDAVTIRANIHLDEEDRAAVTKALSSAGFKVDTIGEEFYIEQRYSFENSQFKGKRAIWSTPVYGKPARAKKPRMVSPSEPKAWQALLSTVARRLPPIIYYPNFLFDFPDRIYLSERTGEGKEQVFYRRLLQDVLDSVGEELTLGKHIIDRASSESVPDREALESVINKMSLRITSNVLSQELSVFPQRGGTRMISVSVPRADEDGALYVELRLRDGEDSYYIRERSLGFRWFFSFSLFTQFRLRRATGAPPPFFLFDEPASNLHQTAQQKLMRGFEQLTDPSQPGRLTAKVMYATHSHHMINPRWLEGAFIVKNEALQYTDADLDAYTAHQTDIRIVRYREFVSRHPDQRTYFQPILDILEYRPSNLENVPDVVMVEGKNDFYTLTFMNEVDAEEPRPLNLLPGGGAGSLTEALRLYIAWGRNFLVLLDSDAEGSKQAARYAEEFGSLVEGRIATLSSLCGETVKGMEAMFTDEELNFFRGLAADKKKKGSKRVTNLGVQEALARRERVHLSPTTRQRFDSLFDALATSLQQLRAIPE